MTRDANPRLHFTRTPSLRGEAPGDDSRSVRDETEKGRTVWTKREREDESEGGPRLGVRRRDPSVKT